MNMLTSLKALLFSSAAMKMPVSGEAGSPASAPGEIDFATLLQGSFETETPMGTMEVAVASSRTTADVALASGGADGLDADMAFARLPQGPGAEMPKVPAADVALPIANVKLAPLIDDKVGAEALPDFIASPSGSIVVKARVTSADDGAIGADAAVELDPPCDPLTIATDSGAGKAQLLPVGKPVAEEGAPSIEKGTGAIVTPQPPRVETPPIKHFAPPCADIQAATVNDALGSAPMEEDMPTPSDTPATDKEAEGDDDVTVAISPRPETVQVAAMLPVVPLDHSPVVKTEADVVPVSTAPTAVAGKPGDAAAPEWPIVSGREVSSERASTGGKQASVPDSTAFRAMQEDAGPVEAFSGPILTEDRQKSPQSPPVTGDKISRSEALSLLQLVREQMGRTNGDARQGVEIHASSGPALSRQASHAASVSEAPALAPMMAARDGDSAAMTAPPSVPQPAAAAISVAPSPDLGASLGAQVVDMGVSGQWIDGLARDIAGLSRNGAHGRFQVQTDQLGPVQVDIRQGADGAAVSLTVASEAAETALRQDSDRLRLDAGLAAVRIADVKIERAPHGVEAARADGGGQSATQQQGGQQSSSQGQASAWQGAGQSAGQGMAQSERQGHWQARESFASSLKGNPDSAVINQKDAGEGAGNARRARYA